MPHAPTLLGERYRLLERLASGAMGTVWLARDEQLNREVAVKEVLLPADLSDAERATARARVLREARAAARLDDPTVVQVHDVVDDGVRPWIVMELVRGQTLSDAVATNGRLASPFVATVGLAVLRALRATHAAGILHRDVKPSNVILAHDGRIVLTDFGVAQVVGDPSLTVSGMLIGSPSYMPPERAKGELPGPPADLWSLGATLYAAVEGHAPFERGGALPTITAAMTEPHPPAEHASPVLAEVIDRLLIKDPAERLGAADAERLLRAAAAAAAAKAPALQSAPVLEPEPLPVTEPVPVADSPARDYSVLLGGDETRTAVAAQRPRRGVALAVAAVVALLISVVAGAVALDTPLGDLLSGDDSSTSTAGGTATGGTAADGATAEDIADADGVGDPVQPGVPAATPGASSQPLTPTDPSLSAQPVPAPTSAAAETSPPASDATGGDTVPAGYRLHEDETGFSVAVPAAWTVERDGTLVDFEDPASGRFLRIDQTNEPKGDPVADWVAQEQTVSQRLDGYALIGIDGLDYRGWEAADWEFTFGINTPTHVLSRNVVTGPMAYALYWSVPASEWDSSQEIFEVAADTFQPAAG